MKPHPMCFVILLTGAALVTGSQTSADAPKDKPADEGFVSIHACLGPKQKADTRLRRMSACLFVVDETLRAWHPPQRKLLQ